MWLTCLSFGVSIRTVKKILKSCATMYHLVWARKWIDYIIDCTCCTKWRRFNRTILWTIFPHCISCLLLNSQSISIKYKENMLFMTCGWLEPNQLALFPPSTKLHVVMGKWLVWWKSFSTRHFNKHLPTKHAPFNTCITVRCYIYSNKFVSNASIVICVLFIWLQKNIQNTVHILFTHRVLELPHDDIWDAFVFVIRICDKMQIECANKAADRDGEWL